MRFSPHPSAITLSNPVMMRHDLNEVKPCEPHAMKNLTGILSTTLPDSGPRVALGWP